MLELGRESIPLCVVPHDSLASESCRAHVRAYAACLHACLRCACTLASQQGSQVVLLGSLACTERHQLSTQHLTCAGACCRAMTNSHPPQVWIHPKLAMLHETTVAEGS